MNSPDSIFNITIGAQIAIKEISLNKQDFIPEDAYSKYDLASVIF
jgi:hypothetical protein